MPTIPQYACWKLAPLPVKLAEDFCSRYPKQISGYRPQSHWRKDVRSPCPVTTVCQTQPAAAFRNGASQCSVKIKEGKILNLKPDAPRIPRCPYEPATTSVQTPLESVSVRAKFFSASTCYTNGGFIDRVRQVWFCPPTISLRGLTRPQNI
jgi:hypothetical protein